MGSRCEVPVFTDTNLGTHIAMAVPPEITAGDFNRELERAHLNCFPELGEIRVDGLMVKRKSCFYHLPQTLPIKNAFLGLKGTWFLHIEACFSSVPKKSGLSNCVTTDLRDHSSNISDVTNPPEAEDCFTSANKNNPKGKRKMKRRIKPLQYFKAVLQKTLRTIHLAKKKKRRRKIKKTRFRSNRENKVEKGFFSGNEGLSTEKKFGFSETRTECQTRQNGNSSLLVEIPSETLSVKGVIGKYFSNYDDESSSSEVTSRATQNGYFSRVQVSATPQFSAKTPPRTLSSLLPTNPSFRTLKDELQRVGVGQRLVVASNKLGISSSDKKRAVDLCRFTSSSLVRSLVFEISDSDE